MRCAEFYVCLTTPIYFTRASPPPRQEERDANQTCWLDCDHDRIGWHRGCGGCIWPPQRREVGLAPGAAHSPTLLDARFDTARRRLVGASTPPDDTRPYPR